MFVVQQSFLLTLMIFLSLPTLARRLVVHRFDDVSSRLEQVEQRSSRALLRLGNTSDTSGDESDIVGPRRRLRSKKTYKMKRAWGTIDIGRFFVTGPTDDATKPSLFYCRICHKDVLVMTHGHHEILRHFQVSKHFPRDQHLRLETPGWDVLDYEGNTMSPVEVERQREKIMRAHLFLRQGVPIFRRRHC